MTRYLTLAVRTVTAAMLCRAAWQTARAAGAEVAGVVADVRALRALRADFEPVDPDALERAAAAHPSNHRPELEDDELEPDPAAEVLPGE